MNSFPSIEKLDTIILYILELASSLSVLLLAFGLIASVANVLTNGATLTNHSWAQEAYAWTQAVAIDASVAGVIIRTFQYRKEGQRIKMWLYAVLSCLLLFTAAIVSNIESIQQTLSAAFLKGDNKRSDGSGDGLMARSTPDPRIGAPIELSGRDASGLLNFISVGKALPSQGIASEEAPPALL